MPIYEYRCCDCEQIFEEWLKTYDTSARTCPVCGGTSEHIVSNTTFALKGGGWYVTDYGNKKSSCTAEGSTAPASGTDNAASSTPAAPAAPAATGAAS